ncbi:hypothetical protein ACHQM5_021927 [Ranunculus cassubicifolius]
MASAVPKIRIVRCPKCLKLLTELENVPVYRCGGCDTTLKAKKRKEVQKSESSKAHNHIPAQKIEERYDSEENDSANSSQRALTCSTDGYEQDDHADFHKEKSANRRPFNGSGSSDEGNWHEKGESSLVAGRSRKANGNHERGRDLGYPTHDRQGISERGNFTSPVQKPTVESSPSKPSSSSLSKELDISEKIVRRYADLIGSRGPVKSRGASIISEPQASEIYHANGASGSSNVVRENQVSNHTSKEYGSEYQKVDELSSSNKGAIMEDISVDVRNDAESKVLNQTKKLSVMSVNENHDTSVQRSVSLRQDQLAERNVILQVQNDKEMVGKSLEDGLQFSESPGTKIFHEYNSSVSSDDGVLVSDLQSNKSEDSISISSSQRVDEVIVTNEETTMEDASINNMTDTKSEIFSVPIIGNHVPVVLDSVSLHQDELPQNTELRNQVQDDNITSEDDMLYDGIRSVLNVSKSSNTKIFHEYNHSVSSDAAWEAHGSDIHSLSGSQRVEEEPVDTYKAIVVDVSVDSEIDTELDVPPMSMNGNHSPVVLGNVSLQEDELPQNTECGIQVQDDSITSEDEMVCNKIGGDIGVSNIPAIKSFHAYDASVSSNDGWGDQVSDFHSHQSKESFSESQKVADNEAIRGKESSVNDMMDTEPDMRRPSRKFSLTSVIENHSMHHQDEFPQYSRYQIQVQDQVHSNFSSFKSTQTSFKSTQSWLGVDRERLQTQKYSTQRFPPADYEVSALPTRNYPPHTLESVERKQIELLRRVEELSAQLNRSYGHNTRANERLQPSPYETYPPSRVTSFQCSYHQMPNCSCSNAYSGQQQSLPRSPLPKRYYSEDLGRGYSDQASYSVYSSDRSTSEPHVVSRCPLREGCILPYDQINKNQSGEPREKCPKRHYRPIAGGAPFITCYSCKKLLFLPADSFLSNKRLHRLQCGSCSKVLTFSFHEGSLVSPYTQNDVASSKGSTSTRNSVFRSHPHPIDNQGDPLSYSEDLGLSIRKSDSTYGDISTDQSRSVDRKQQPFGKLVKKEIKNRTSPKPKSSTQASISGSPSYNEAESAREEATFALHRLMGYSSVSRLLRAPSS